MTMTLKLSNFQLGYSSFDLITLSWHKICLGRGPNKLYGDLSFKCLDYITRVDYAYREKYLD